MSVEERIKQKAKVPFDSKGFPLFADSFNHWRSSNKVTEKSSLVNGWIKLKDVLQILADYVIMPKKELKSNLELLGKDFEPAFKIVDMEKWRELLKLLKHRPHITLHQMPNFISHGTFNRLKTLINDYEKCFEKIEEKLKELQK